MPAGIAIPFCDSDASAYLRDIEKTIRQSVPVIVNHPYHAAEIANDPGQIKRGLAKRGPQRMKRQSQGRGQRPRNPRHASRNSGRPAGKAA